MPRQCLCTRLRQRMATDPRLVTLPMAAKWLWLSLAERAAEHPDGVIPLGSGFGFLTGIAMLIQAAEPEIETHWETLVARGLARREGDAVVIPDLPTVTARAATARANGGLGGRPRRGETPEQARLRRAQGAMLLPVAGGAAKPRETQREPVGSGATTTVNSTSQLVVSAGETRVSHSALGAELAETAGLDPVRARFDYRPVREWLDAGIDPDTIREAVAAVVARPGYDPARVTSLRYFAPRLAEAQAASAPPPIPSAPTGMAAAILAWAADGADPARYPGRAA
jgi:hypothetical protein